MSAETKEALGLLERARPHIEALSVTDEDPEFILLLADIDAALSARKAMAQDGLPENGAYLIRFDDADRKDEFFAGHGSRDAALHRYEQISGSWNAHLFAKIDSNSRDEQTPNAASPQPREVAAVEAVRVPDRRCQCDACRTDGCHDSDCAVHNMPVYPNGACNCRLSAAAAESLARQGEAVAAYRHRNTGLPSSPKELVGVRKELLSQQYEPLYTRPAEPSLPLSVIREAIAAVCKEWGSMEGTEYHQGAQRGASDALKRLVAVTPTHQRHLLGVTK